MPPRDSKKIFTCPQCKNEIKPITHFIKKDDPNKNEENLLTSLQCETITEDFLKNDYYVSHFKIYTVQSGAMKILFKSLSNYLNEITLKITKNSISFIKRSYDNIIFHVRMASENFENFQISNDVKLHINLIQFRDIIKNLQNDDTLSITKDKDSYLWKVCFNNCEKNTQSVYTFENNINKIETIKLSPLEFSSELRMGNHIIDESLKKMNPLSPKTLDLIFTNYEFKLSCQNKDNSISCENTFCVNDYFSVEKFTDNLKKTINYEKFSIPTAFRDLCVFTYIYMEKGKNYIVLRIDIANLGQLKIILPCII
tara:strand:+ start:1363 stop:2298 length:936 start_codon:yes stop_codon:yes gene_type:complete